MPKKIQTFKKSPVGVAGGVCSVSDNGVVENRGSAAVEWSARALLRGCGLAAKFAPAVPSARGSVGAYRRGGAVCG